MNKGTAITSGQPILPKGPYNTGSFIIPNVPISSPPSTLLWQLNGLEAGNALQGGDPVNGGTGSSDGKGPDGGEVPTGGQATNGSGSQGSSGSTTGGEEKMPSLLNTLVKTTDGERGWFSHGTGFFDDFKTYGLGFLNRNVAGAALSIAAGFEIQKIAGSNGYKVSGKKNLKLFDSLYQRYKSYDINGNDRSLGTHTKRIKEKTLNTFLQSKELMPKKMAPLTFVSNSIKSGVIDGWSPFTKKAFTTLSGWKDGSAFNKAFVSKSNMMKMNGPLNYAMATAGTIWDYTGGNEEKSKIGWKSTDFAADISTELAIGVGSTAIGSLASSMAIGAVAGSVVPGLGTVAGAAAGLFAGLGTAVFVNRTKLGQGMKKGIRNGFKFLYDGASKGLGKVAGLFGK